MIRKILISYSYTLESKNTLKSRLDPFETRIRYLTGREIIEEDDGIKIGSAYVNSFETRKKIELQKHHDNDSHLQGIVKYEVLFVYMLSFSILEG